MVNSPIQLVIACCIVLDGNSEHVAGKQVFFSLNFKFDAASEVNKCLKQIKLPKSLHICALRSEIPSNINSMRY